MTEKVISQVEFEIQQIDRLLALYAHLFERVHKGVPDLVDVTAVASVLHSFYNALEIIFLSISKGIDTDVPAGDRWHRSLLTRMAEPTSSRGPVLTTETTQRLADYLGFRHFFRHSYSFVLEWDELEMLVTPLAKVWIQVRDELELFLVSLSAAKPGTGGT